MSSSAPGTGGCRTREKTLSMAPLDSRALTACWRSWQLFLVRNVMLWWVSWGRWTKVRPTPSWTVLVARQVLSKLCHWWAKPARRAPTCNPSMLACHWSSGRSFGLPSLRLGRTAPGSPAGACTKGLSVLGDSLLDRCWFGRRPQAVEDWGPGLLALLACGCLLAGLGWNWVLSCLMECHRGTSHPVCLPDAYDMLLQHFRFQS